MVRDVRYITLNSSYRDLQEMLMTGQLKTLALVESRGKSIHSMGMSSSLCLCLLINYKVPLRDMSMHSAQSYDLF